MKINFFFLILLTIGFIPRAFAEPVIGDLGKQNLSQTESQISQANSEELEVAVVTGIGVISTSNGLEVALETESGQLLQVSSTTTEGDTLVVEIPDAQLSLPDSNEFFSDNPTEGITAVTATNLNANTIEIRIIGFDGDGAPSVEVFSGQQQELILSVTPAISQVPEIGFEDDIEDIIITADKTEENLQDVPISVTAITEQGIEDAGIVSFEGIADNTPNFSTFSSGSNRSFLNYSIRGLSNSVLNRDAVALYVDDIPYSNGNFINVDLPDLERVEVLRGPQSTLYGRSAIAGVVNIITSKPSNEWEFNASTSYGNFNNFEFQGAISGPLVEDELFFRFSGNYGSREGYTENLFLNDDVDDQSGGTGRGQLLWTPTEDWEISFVGSFDDNRDGPTVFAPQNSTAFEVNQNVEGFSNLVANSQAFKAVYDDENIRFTSITARRYAQNEEEFDADFSVLDLTTIQGKLDSTTFSQEFRLQSADTEEQFQWLLGSYFESLDSSNDTSLVLGSAIALVGGTPATILTSSEAESRTFAIFGQASYQPVEELTLTAGLRYENNENELVRLERILTPTGLPFSLTTASFANIENDSEAWLPRFIAEYRFTPELMVYGSIARGYRPAGVNFQASVEDAVPFNSERSWNYELGLKSSWFDDRLFVNVALFHNDVEDYQLTFFNPSVNASVVSNVGAEITGAELEIRATPTPGLDFIAGLGLIDGELTDITNPFTGQTSNASELLFAPDVTYNLAVQYRSPVGIFGRVELVGYGTTFFDEENTFKQEPFAIVNARLGYEYNDYGIYFFANNLFDEEYVTNGLEATSGNVVSYGAPFTYGFQIRAKF